MNSRAFYLELGRAVAAAADLAEEAYAKAPIQRRLHSAAIGLLHAESSSGRAILARSIGLGALGDLTFGLSPATRPKLAAFVVEHLVPLGDYVFASAMSSGVIPKAAGSRIEMSRTNHLIRHYEGRGDRVWETMEALARIASLREVLTSVETDSPAADSLRADTLSSLDAVSSDLCHGIGGRQHQEPAPRIRLRTRASLHEALANSVLDANGRDLTLALSSEGYLRAHMSAVSAVLGPFPDLPVRVLGENRWFGELGGGDHRMVRARHFPGEAVLLSREAGEAAHRDKAESRLNFVVLHELVHACNHAGSTPGVQQPEEHLQLERELGEGLADYAVCRILQRARDVSNSSGPLYGRPRQEARRSPYYGYQLICRSAVRIGGIPASALLKVGRSSHKVAAFATLLTGRSDLTPSKAMAQVFQDLFSTADDRRHASRSIQEFEVALTTRADARFAAYRDHFATHTEPRSRRRCRRSPPSRSAQSQASNSSATRSSYSHVTPRLASA